VIPEALAASLRKIAVDLGIPALEAFLDMQVANRARIADALTDPSIAVAAHCDLEELLETFHDADDATERIVAAGWLVDNDRIRELVMHVLFVAGSRMGDSPPSCLKKRTVVPFSTF
jgi:hypothetical protein